MTEEDVIKLEAEMRASNVARGWAASKVPVVRPAYERAAEAVRAAVPAPIQGPVAPDSKFAYLTPRPL